MKHKQVRLEIFVKFQKMDDGTTVLHANVEETDP